MLRGALYQARGFDSLALLVKNKQANRVPWYGRDLRPNPARVGLLRSYGVITRKITFVNCAAPGMVILVKGRKVYYRIPLDPECRTERAKVTEPVESKICLARVWWVQAGSGIDEAMLERLESISVFFCRNATGMVPLGIDAVMGLGPVVSAPRDLPHLIIVARWEENLDIGASRRINRSAQRVRPRFGAGVGVLNVPSWRCDAEAFW